MPGLHIGYRKNAGGGRWVARIYIGSQTYHVEVFADADDVADANGTSILEFLAGPAEGARAEGRAGPARRPGPEPGGADRRRRRLGLHRQTRPARQRAAPGVRSAQTRRGGCPATSSGSRSGAAQAAVPAAPLAAIALPR